MNRENWADYVKALAIWMMVFAHANLSNESISDFIGTFHMPVFFLISGYFDKGNKDIWNVVKKNVKTILIPYFFFSICAFSICWISPTVHPELYPGIDSWWDIYKAALIGMFLMDDQVTSYSFMPLGPLWFLAAMFIVRVFWAILLKILSYVRHSNTLLGSLYLVLVFLLLSVVCYKHVPVFSLDSAVLAFPFYIGGYLLAKYKVVTYLNDTWTLLPLSLCCVSYLILVAPFNGHVDLDGCLWGNQQMADFCIDYLRPELNKQGLQDTKIIYGELPWWANAVDWVKTSLENNPNLVDADIVAAGHGYSTVDANILPMAAAEEKGIHVWQTETCDDKTRDETWNDAMKWAKNYHDYLTKARTNAIVWWAGARQCSTTGENLLQTNAWDFSDDYYRVDRYYSIGQFSRYIQRGSIRVDVETVSTTANRIPRDLSASAYIKDDTYTIVLVNKSQSKAFDTLLEIEGKEFDSMISYTSNSSVKWLRKKLNPSSTGKRYVNVPKYSVVTITGRFKEKGTQTER